MKSQSLWFVSGKPGLSLFVFIMFYKFSEKLRNRLIKYFKETHNLDISHDQAEEYLNSMADLYSLFNKKELKK